MSTLTCIAILLSPAGVAASGSIFPDNSVLLSKLRRDNDLSVNPPLDQSLLAIQVGGIVGAYVIFVAVLLTLLLFIGRRLRRTVQSSNFSLQVEMMRPAKPSVSIDPSPVTPISVNLPSPNRPNNFNRSWSSLARGSRSHISGNGSVATIDESVIAYDRRRAQEEMEMLYAAVLEHDEQKAAGATSSEEEKDVQSPDSAMTNPFTDRSSRVSEGPSAAPMRSPMKSPTSPRSSRLSKISSLSLFNSNNNTNPRSPADTSKLRSPRIALRKLPISSPVGSPDVTASASYGEEQPPLTPRTYNPPPPPTPPAAIGRAPHERVPGVGRAPAPAPLTLSTVSSQGASSLPFRDAFPLQSAPATKTTVLERPEKPIGGPRTGLPTPYSPYMPFTPVTPLTPSRIVTKRQRKREVKENGLRVLNEDDMVRDDGDVWG
ncbi:hypothetical protein P170DRAFT_461152 [Aspergillus steynii IBT 23096]|uniref:Uncharacterized protein n=1 Tax=Aspergillus steynii IBT 23096 TaxID=1392250 RepID=A0A2I2GQU6_9EURO|nr:uncharacterized protein P170DRAFT_461152 [Aspergillus steynii IBT 23096]PLB55233.1 hypothetical protein P170DRAFT_461152 [Aspergillus steynii IBT 23096]